MSYLLRMNKKSIIQELTKLESELTTLISLISEKPELKVSGSLICYERGETIEYQHLLDDGSRVYIAKDNRKLLVSLAQKKHYLKMMDAATREIKQIDRCLKALQSDRCISDIDDVFPSLHKGIQNLSGPFTVTDDGYAVKWLKDNLKGSTGKKQLTGELETSRGIKVKSKSEVIIADRLDLAGVPYVYEFTLGLDNGNSIRYPDFYVLNKRTRKTYFWEHLGMLDKGNYCYASQVKLDEYARNGYFPGKNLLITFESENRPLSTKYVDMLIKEYLL